MAEMIDLYGDEIAAWVAFLNLVLTSLTIAWALTIKREPMSAMAWCLVIFFLPFLGALLFVLLGYQQVHKPMSRKARHKQNYRRRHPGGRAAPAGTAAPALNGWEAMADLALRCDGTRPNAGNAVTFYHDGPAAFAAKLAAIRAARHHIHLEYFIFQPDALGREFLDVLTEKAKQGVEVRLVYDAMGSHRLHRWMLRDLRSAGGRCGSFLPLDPLRRRIQINMRNHRKILVIDGQVAFTGGLNVGDEYLGLVPRFGWWRDTHLRITGPAVAGLQRVFTEDWDFAAGEALEGRPYFAEPEPDAERPAGAIDCTAQVIQSGPDQEIKGIREVFFAAILRARKRLWIASPYFVPDAALRDALMLAGYQGVDVRLLGQFHPDKWVPYFAARYYWADVLEAGVKVYQYTRGMMHAKVMVVDGEWATVGTANFDNRSMHLNFEVNCLFYTPAVVAELEAAFRRDLADSIQLNRDVYQQRPFAGRLIENACRLLSPVL